MNEQTQKYWQAYCQKNNLDPKTEADAFQFGYDADALGQLIVDGIKTATCSGKVFYDLEKEPLPQAGTYDVVLNSKDEPMCIIQVTDVTVMPFNEVPESFARAEGEGDLSYDYWYQGHVDFFTEACKEAGVPFTLEMPVVCERFHVVDVYNG
ncbi:MAG: ASCH domain-containing protein [Turicibacter sp.]|nr:ASCH domain-containing protein [Turicibacter sp.]